MLPNQSGKHWHWSDEAKARFKERQALKRAKKQTQEEVPIVYRSADGKEIIVYKGQTYKIGA